jgi:drug/metabolite transporter (DMT)-like permease
MVKSPRIMAAHAAMLTVSLLYGVNYFTMQGLLGEHHNHFAIVAMRVIVGAAIFVPYQLLVVRERITDRKDLWRLAACALFGITINQELFVWGLGNTAKVNAAVLMIGTPVFVFLVLWLGGKDRISLAKVGGLLAGVLGSLGLIFLNYDGGVRFSTETLFGDVLITCNAASYGIYLVLVRPLAMKYNTFTIMAGMFALSLPPVLLIGGAPLAHFDFAGMSQQAWFGLAFLILGATLAAYFLNGWAMRHVSSAAVGVCIFVQPIFVTLGSAMLEKGSITWFKLLFILLIFASVYLVVMHKESNPRKNENNSRGNSSK